jgi:hypothetical protein
MQPHPNQPQVVIHGKHRWDFDTLPKLAAYHGLKSLTLPEWLSLLFPGMIPSQTYDIFQTFLAIHSGQSICVTWRAPYVPVAADILQTKHIRWHGLPPQALKGVRDHTLLPSGCATGMTEGQEIAVLFTTPSLICATGYAGPLNAYGKKFCVVLAVEWHQLRGNPAHRLSSLSGRKYTQNRIPPGDYDVDHVRFECVEGGMVPSVFVDGPKLKKDMARRRRGTRYVFEDGVTLQGPARVRFAVPRRNSREDLKAKLKRRRLQQRSKRRLRTAV